MGDRNEVRANESSQRLIDWDFLAIEKTAKRGPRMDGPIFLAETRQTFGKPCTVTRITQVNQISAAFTGRPRVGNATDTNTEKYREGDGEKSGKRRKETDGDRTRTERKLVTDPDSTSNAAQCIARTCMRRVRSVHEENKAIRDTAPRYRGARGPRSDSLLFSSLFFPPLLFRFPSLFHHFLSFPVFIFSAVLYLILQTQRRFVATITRAAVFPRSRSFYRRGRGRCVSCTNRKSRGGCDKKDTRRCDK